MIIFLFSTSIIEEFQPERSKVGNRIMRAECALDFVYARTVRVYVLLPSILPGTICYQDCLLPTISYIGSRVKPARRIKIFLILLILRFPSLNNN